MLEGLVGLHRTVLLQLLQHYRPGCWLGLWWYWMVCLGNKHHSVIFKIAPKYCIPDSFVDYEGYSISSNGFLPTVVDIMVIWVKFTHPVHFSLLIPKMSTFTVVISCPTTSNLPWFMDLTLQVPMQYCSSQHQTLLPSPVTSTIGVVVALAPESLHSF